MTDQQERRVGIEIEAESNNVSRQDIHHLFQDRTAYRHWQLDLNEGSLRGGDRGWEIKTPGSGQPLSVALASLRSLYPVLQGSSGIWRAAVHVHVDVTDLTPLQRAFALGMAYCVDDSLFEVFSPERRESNFCVPLNRKAASVLDTINDMAHGRPNRNFGKYTSVNVHNADTLGTFEFRHMRTPEAGTDIPSVTRAIDQIGRFTTTCHDIINSVTAVDTPQSIKQVVENLSSLARSGYIGAKLGLTLDEEALFDVVKRLENFSVPDRMATDIASLSTVAPGSTRFTFPQERRSLGAELLAEIDELPSDPEQHRIDTLLRRINAYERAMNVQRELRDAARSERIRREAEGRLAIHQQLLESVTREYEQVLEERARERRRSTRSIRWYDEVGPADPGDGITVAFSTDSTITATGGQS